LIVFLGLNISIYYHFDIGKLIHNASESLYFHLVIYFLIYAYGYYTTAFWYGYIYKNPLVLSTKFLIPSLLILFILAAERSFPIHKLSDIIIPYPFVHYTSRLFKLLSLPVLLGLVYIILNRIIYLNQSTIGFTTKYLNIKPFIYLLTGIIPLVVIASFNKGFQDYYPMYKTTLASEATNTPEYIFVIIYEFIYGVNLLSVEVLFRGILIIGFIRYLGKGSIFPMVTVYCFIHFGKPVAECISSVFGGYILGVIALYTRSIFGGSMLHIGMAWMMEICAWIQKLQD